MGGHLSRGGRGLRLLMAGLPGAGQATFLREMRLGGVCETELAPGLVVQTMEHRGFSTAISVTAMDVEGSTELGPGLLSRFGEPPNGLVFVIDSSDDARLEEAKAAFDRMLASDALGEAPLLVVVTKMDAPGARSLSQITTALGLHSLAFRRWRIQPCGVTDRGVDQSLFKGLDWLAGALRRQAKHGPPAPRCSQHGGRPRARAAGASPSSCSVDTDSTRDPEEVGREDSMESNAELADEGPVNAPRAGQRQFVQL